MNEKYKLQVEKKSINEVQKTELTNSDENIIPPPILLYNDNELLTKFEGKVVFYDFTFKKRKIF